MSSIMVSHIYNRAEMPEGISQGDILRDRGEDELYVVARPDNNHLCLINLRNGNRWANPVEAPHTSPRILPKSVVDGLMGRRGYVNMEYIGQGQEVIKS